MLLVPFFFLLARPAAAQADQPAAKPDTPPNVVIIFCDDLGYSDVGSFGAKALRRPISIGLAREGRRFTNFYVGTGGLLVVASGAVDGLLSQPDRHCGRVGSEGPAWHQRRGIDAGQCAPSRGYATAIVGKWHLGHHPQFLPTRHGFDEYFGIPYSNDMGSPDTTPNSRTPAGRRREGDRTRSRSVATDHPVYRASGRLHRRKHEQPFFLYVAQTMPHVPLYVSDKFKGKPAAGLFGDVVMEIDWSVGQIFDALDKYKLADRTLVVFTSDNGPWLIYGNHGGSARPLREGKLTTFDGGVREPCIMPLAGPYSGRHRMRRAGDDDRSVADTSPIWPGPKHRRTA